MATRIKEGMIPYKGGVGIEITNNHIINVLLREANNLIHVNDNNELYVDLQLDDGIQPDDDFPVGVTTGKILEEDGWQQSGLILNWKTTSGDYARIIYANDGNVYIDLGDGVWRQIGIDISEIGNVKAFYPTDLNETTEGQAMVDWYLAGKYPIVVYRGESYILEAKPMSQQIRFYDIHSTVMHLLNDGYSYSFRNALYATWDVNNEFQGWLLDQVQISPSVLATDIDYQTPYTPQYLGSPTTKYYVDQELLKKQDVLTAGTRITIQKDPNTGQTIISADVSGVMTYKGNVTDPSQLPTTGQQVGDCWFSESDSHLYAWDGTQWKDIGGMGINLNDYFNFNINTSDDITEGNIHLFCTAIEKNYWNNKQDKLIAGENIHFSGVNNTVINAVDTKYTGGNGITVNGTVINNDSPFDPENAGAMGQFLQKTSDGYKWINPNFVISVNNQTGAVTVDEFTPANEGTAGQVLKKTQNGYEWQNETAGQYTGDTGIQVNQASKTIKNTLPFNPTNTGRAGQVIKLNSDGVTYSWQNDESGGGGGGGGGNFNPDNTGQPGQVLTKKTNGRYEWEDVVLPSGENNVKFWTIDTLNDDYALNQEIVDWVSADNNNGAVLNDLGTNDVFILHHIDYYQGIPRPVFYGKKRSSAKKWVNDIVGGPRGQYTKAWENKLELTERPSGGYFSTVSENNDDATHTNYISAFGANYDGAYMPQLPSEPATKAYVDQAVAAGPSGVGGITNNITGTTSRLATIWVGSTTELNNISQRDPTCLYFSFSS